MGEHVCPWWGGYFLDNRLRRLIHQPDRILGPFLSPGMTVMDFGCGMGLFSIAAAKLVGATGTVIAVDLQPRMLSALRKRAEKAGVADWIRTHVCPRESVGIRQPIDFALAFWSLHEAPDPSVVLTEIHNCLVDRGKLLIAEPRGHVSGKDFEQMTRVARRVGLNADQQVRVRLSRAITFVKSDEDALP